MAHFSQVSDRVIRSRARMHPDMGSDSWHAFCRDAGRYDVLTKRQVALAMNAGNKEKMILHNLRLAVAVTQRSCVVRVPLMDTLSLALEGLIRAVETYNHKESRFSTYAVPWMLAMINRGHDRIIYPLTISRQTMSDIRAQDKGRERLKSSPENIELGRIATLKYQRIGLDLDDFDIDVKDKISDHEVELCDARLSVDNLKKRYWHILTPREADVIERHFLEQETLESISDTYGLTREMMRQVCQTGFKKLRKAMQRESIGNRCIT